MCNERRHWSFRSMWNVFLQLACLKIYYSGHTVSYPHHTASSAETLKKIGPHNCFRLSTTLSISRWMIAFTGPAPRNVSITQHYHSSWLTQVWWNNVQLRRLDNCLPHVRTHGELRACTLKIVWHMQTNDWNYYIVYLYLFCYITFML